MRYPNQLCETVYSKILLAHKGLSSIKCLCVFKYTPHSAHMPLYYIILNIYIHIHIHIYSKLGTSLFLYDMRKLFDQLGQQYLIERDDALSCHREREDTQFAVNLFITYTKHSYLICKQDDQRILINLVAYTRFQASQIEY